MCGISGYYSQKPNSAAAKIKSLLKPIACRGIKNYIDWNDTSAFGYARLPTDAVLNDIAPDLVKKGFVYNGIIYNIDFLVRKFNIPPTIAYSDSLVLEYGFRKYREAFISEARGMFAFAAAIGKKIFLVRDTIGIKPLYFVHDKQYFAFSSEMKSLTRLHPQLITEVNPGQIVIYNKKRDTLTQKQFTYLGINKYSMGKLNQALRESLIEPTKRYLSQAKNIKIALCISGGLDSSIILAMLKQYLKVQEMQRIITFTVALPDSEDDLYAKKITRHYGVPHKIVRPFSKKESLKKVKEMVYKTESPYSRVIKVALLQDALAKTVQKMGIRVLISGEGADELFYGYKKFIDGMNTKEIDHIYRTFFKKTFHRSLLQRLDRVFAQRQIEARVPFLDQEIVSQGSSLPIERKIKITKKILLPKRICVSSQNT